MKTATIRDMRHKLTEVLGWVEDGEEVRITKRGKIVAVMGLPKTEKSSKSLKAKFRERFSHPPQIPRKPLDFNIVLKMREDEHQERPW
jgi:prevent-host-death family protein